MTSTPYDIIGQEALYKMIDHFYTLVEQDDKLITYFLEIFKKQVESKSNS